MRSIHYYKKSPEKSSSILCMLSHLTDGLIDSITIEYEFPKTNKLNMENKGTVTPLAHVGPVFNLHFRRMLGLAMF